MKQVVKSERHVQHHTTNACSQRAYVEVTYRSQGAALGAVSGEHVSAT
jgi:hypothetical protein